jgi:hypothetical protein
VGWCCRCSTASASYGRGREPGKRCVDMQLHWQMARDLHAV